MLWSENCLEGKLTCNTNGVTAANFKMKGITPATQPENFKQFPSHDIPKHDYYSFNDSNTY